MTAYLQTWTDGATDALERAGEPIVHAASNQYARRGIGPGDTLYIAYLADRRMHLLGRLTIDRILTRDQAVDHFGPGIWDADFHAVGSPTELALFDVRVPDEVLRSLAFVRGDGKTTTLDVGPGGSVNGQALQAIRRLTPESSVVLDEVLDDTSSQGAGWLGASDQDIERRAMATVRKHYELEGWTVQDVSNHRPYDLVCRRASDELHVEVKGLSGRPARVQLTANEVEHARTCRDPVLAVVSNLSRRSAAPVEGTLHVYDPWQLHQAHLRATAYSYALS